MAPFLEQPAQIAKPHGNDPISFPPTKATELAPSATQAAPDGAFCNLSG